ncbi:MAG: polyprenyl synthetase family protein [Opitutales bacterium]|nr:polyprenyl synthetase family protein [Opitutales bacterium]
MSTSGEATAAPRLAEGIDAITLPLAAHFEQLEMFLEAQVEAFEPEVRPLVRYTFGHSGKKIRPILVFYAGLPGSAGAPDEGLIRAAAIVELVHLATLVHDDILDGADTRHRVETAVARYGPHAAVLLGDALFAHALKLAADFPDVTVCRLVSRATRQVCSGEIAQTFARKRFDISMEDYFRFIDLKTAELFAVSARLGAMLGGYPAAFCDAVEVFARRLGAAYQIYDDLTDFAGREERAGKTLGTDLQSGKLTLPLLLYLDSLPGGGAESLRADIAAGRATPESLDAAMRGAGVYGRVRDRFYAEVDAAEAALQPYADLPAGAELPRLSGFIRQAIRRHVE